MDTMKRRLQSAANEALMAFNLLNSPDLEAACSIKIEIEAADGRGIVLEVLSVKGTGLGAVTTEFLQMLTEEYSNRLRSYEAGFHPEL